MACQAASDQPACEVIGGAMVSCGLPRPWSERDEPGAAPDGGLLSQQGVLSGQRRGGGFRGFPHPPWHKLPEGSRL